MASGKSIPPPDIRLHDVLNYLSTDEGFRFLAGPAAPVVKSFSSDEFVFRSRDEAAMALIGELVPLFVEGAKEPVEHSPLDIRVNRAIPVSESLGDLLQSVAAAKRAGKLDRSHRPMARMTGAQDEILPYLAPFDRGYWGADRMPMLPLVSERLGGPEALKDVKVASMGHLFWTTPALFEELEANGVRRENHIVGGKGYSKDPVVVAQLLADAWNVDRDLVTKFLYTRDTTMEEKRAVAILEQLFEGCDPENRDQKFLLLDDGGFLVTALHKHAHLRKFAHLCHAVEQTDSGIDRIRREVGEENLLCSVEDYGRSSFKSEIESPMIGEAVVTETLRNLVEAHERLTLGKTVGVFGFGDVGQATVKSLLRKGVPPESIRVFDIDPAKMELAESWGLQTPPRQQTLNESTTIFLCAAGEVLTPADYNDVSEGTIIVNAASGREPTGLQHMEVRGGTSITATPHGTRYRRITTESEIGDSQTERFLFRALEVHSRFGMEKSASVTGFNERGQRAFELLVRAGFRRHDIVVFDPDARVREGLRRDGYRVVETIEEASKHGRILVNQLQDMDPVETTKGASASIVVHNTDHDERFPIGNERFEYAAPEVETPQDDWKASFRGLVIETGAGGEASGYRHRLVTNGYGARILVLRGGFVINMSTGLPPEYVQLILSSLLALSLQAVKRDKPGIYSIADEVEAVLRDCMALTMGADAWLQPSFDGLAGKWQPAEPEDARQRA